MDVRHSATRSHRARVGIQEADARASAWETQAILQGRRLSTTRRALEHLNRAYGVLESGMASAARQLADLRKRLEDALADLALARAALGDARAALREKNLRIARIEHEHLIATAQLAGIKAVVSALGDVIADSPLAQPAGPEVFSRGPNAGVPKSDLARIFEQAFDRHYAERSGRSDARDHRPD